MTDRARSLRSLLRRATPEDATAPSQPHPDRAPGRAEQQALAIDPADPLLGYLQDATGAVEVDDITIDTPGVRTLREAGVKVIVPLVSQRELIGILTLGPRLSEQEYSGDDRRLLATLAAQAAPAVRVAQLVREQEADVRARERFEEEMRVAQLIQQQFLPRRLPDLPGWQVATHYGPARAVGGDFYDFIELADGRLAIVVGDVTDKGVPAALVMARTHSIIRSLAGPALSPGDVLQQTNELLVREMPEHMFVTCLYVLLDPATGHLVFANAGHNLPYARLGDAVVEFRATGMPLGLMGGMRYEEREADLAPGNGILLYSDGLVEAHDQQGEMFGFPRLRGLVHGPEAGQEFLDLLLAELHRFTGPGWDQEDDITLVTLRRNVTAPVPGIEPGEPSVGARRHPVQPPAVTASAGDQGAPGDAPGTWSTATAGAPAGPPSGEQETVLLETTIPGAPGNERIVMDQVAEAVRAVALPPERVERLRTAVAEATMNAIEHGSRNRPEVPVTVRVGLSDGDLVVRITDRGAGGLTADAEVPDLDAKLAGMQTPRGWGLFLIRQMVDAMDISSDGETQTVALTLHLEGGGHADEPL